MRLSLTLGDAGAAELHRAGHTQVIAIHDEFSFGPLTTLTSLATLVDLRAFSNLRAEHWFYVLQSVGAGVVPPEKSSLDAIKCHLNEDQALFGSLVSNADPIEVWASQSLQDLILVALICSLAPNDRPIIVHRPGSTSDKLSAGIGGQDLGALRNPLTPYCLHRDERGAFEKFWLALSTNNRAELSCLAQGQRCQELGLPKAVQAWLLRKPVSGLGSIEQRILDALASTKARPCSAKSLVVKALTSGQAGPDLIGDLSLLYVLKTMVQAPQPLIHLDQDQQMLDASVC